MSLCKRLMWLFTAISPAKKNGTPKGVRLSQKLQLTAALRIECPVNSNTFNLYYFGQENSLQLKLSVAGK